MPQMLYQILSPFDYCECGSVFGPPMSIEGGEFVRHCECGNTQPCTFSSSDGTEIDEENN